jgi:hypothetical protein
MWSGVATIRRTIPTKSRRSRPGIDFIEQAISVHTNRGNIQILKLAAAQRQLDAAIRMKFSGEDVLAVHIVAAAALGLLRDKAKQRGRYVLADSIRAGLYSYAHALVAGTLSSADEALLNSDPQLQIMISDIAAGIKVGTIVSESDISALASEDWRPFTKVANFLKHADRDPDAYLADDEVDNDTVLLTAAGALKMITGTTTPEIDVFYVNWMLEYEPETKLQGVAEEIASALRTVKPATKNRACLRLIKMLKSRRAKLRAIDSDQKKK